MMSSIKKIKLLPEHYQKQEVKIQGWVRSNRDSKKIGFLTLNDGSSMESLQIVYRDNLENFKEVSKVLTGSALEVTGIIEPSNKQEIVELKASNIKCINLVASDYVLQKKNHNLEFLRQKAELRGRTKLFQAIFKIRHALNLAVFKFFEQKNFIYIQSPILTLNDCEGGGESFIVNDSNAKESFFKNNARLTVSGQLHAEAFAQIYKKVYTFGPTFRADKSNTTQHGSEFWMLEPECAFWKKADGIKLAEDLTKFLAQQIYVNYQKELKFLDEKQANGLMEQIERISKTKFVEITYTKALEIIKKGKGEISALDWGQDLKREHELFLTRYYKEIPVFITDYPKKIKAFYMKGNHDQKTVACFDLIWPGIGEIIGGGEREENYAQLIKNLKEKNLQNTELDWYLNLRKQGYGGSTGFGLGLDRLLMFLTGTKNIRDVIPFYRGFKTLKF